MPKRIHEDHKDFKDVIAGKLRKKLKDLIKNGGFVKNRGKNGKVNIGIPKIDIPHIVYGDTGGGVGRGPGKPGDKIGQEPQPGDGDSGAGNDPGEGQFISIDMEEFIALPQEELQLPDLKPKPQETFDEIKIKYNNISLVGPNSLRHNRRTMKEALKREAASGNMNKLVHVPGFADPIRVVVPIKTDFRYRQYTEIKIPSSNAVIFYARDWSGSMDKARCDIVSDMAWWMDCFIRRYYKRTERVFIGHDTVAEECSEDKFYKYRMGGGTNCSSAVKLISSMFEHRYTPTKWNIYVFYFTDGDNWSEDNNQFVKIMKDNFRPEVTNLVGLTQILSWRYESSVKATVDEKLAEGYLPKEIIKTTQIGGETDASGWGSASITDEERNLQIMRAIKDLLGAPHTKGKK
jgi:uncharacterized sporulation protein YeaH/YhbH (DUF444 family)